MDVLYGREHGPFRADPLPDGTVAPWKPTTPFDIRACFANNPGFRTFVEAALGRLHRRGVIRPRFIERLRQRFEAGDRSATPMMRGLLTLDPVLEAGRIAADA